MAVATALRLDAACSSTEPRARHARGRGRARGDRGLLPEAARRRRGLPWLRLAPSRRAATRSSASRAPTRHGSRALGALVEAGGSSSSAPVTACSSARAGAVGRQPLEPGARARDLRPAPRARAARRAVHAWSQGADLTPTSTPATRALILDWNEPRRFHPAWREDWRHRTAWTQSPSGWRIRVLWSEAMAPPELPARGRGQLGPDASRGPRARAARARDTRSCTPRSAEAFAETLAEPRASTAAIRARMPARWRRLAELCEALRSRGVEFTTPQRVLGTGASRPGERSTSPRRATRSRSGASPGQVSRAGPWRAGSNLRTQRALLRARASSSAWAAPRARLAAPVPRLGRGPARRPDGEALAAPRGLAACRARSPSRRRGLRRAAAALAARRARRLVARGRDRGRARRAEPAARPRARVAGPVPRGSAGAPRHARASAARRR